jgi:hypothetical protein
MKSHSSDIFNSAVQASSTDAVAGATGDGDNGATSEISNNCEKDSSGET